MDTIYYIFFGLCLFLLLPVIMFSIEIVLGVYPKKKATRESTVDKDPNTLVLVPAHNEEAVIEATLSSLFKQKCENTKIIVIADNCDDRTAEISRSLGAIVYERSDDTLRGKGYALAFGVEQAKQHKSDVIIIVDADCTLQEGTLSALSKKAYATNTVYQSNYIIFAARDAELAARFSQFAITVKNYVRMIGLSRMGANVHLTGSGMAFPKKIIEAQNLASGEIVEDMKLGIDLALQGVKVNFLDGYLVRSELPESREALQKQRERWEHGHMGVLQNYALPLFTGGLKKIRLSLLLLSADLVIPPLSLLIMIVLAVLLAGVMFAVSQSIYGLLLLSILMLFLFIISLALAWYKCGQDLISPVEIFRVPFYVVSKLTSYLRFFYKREKKWTKTKRRS